LRLSAVTRQVLVGAVDDRDVLEAGTRVLDVEILRGREPVLGDAQARRSVPEDDEALRLGVGKGLEQERVGDAEDRGVGAHAERQRDHRGRDERRVLHEPPQRVPDVRGQHPPASYIPYPAVHTFAALTPAAPVL
jgi:hypothetical protein